MVTDDGGPAFPGPSFTQTGYPNGHAMGMSLRDWLAGQALAGDAANNEEGCFSPGCTHAQLLDQARMYYRIADAMLEASK